MKFDNHGSRSELRDMGTAIATPRPRAMDTENAMAVLEHTVSAGLGHNHHLPGRLEVVKLLHRRGRAIALADSSSRELVYAAKPASRSSQVHWVHFRFEAGPGPLPPPELEHANDRIRLFYPLDQLEQIQTVLRTHRDRFCYFWQAGDASRVRAWLFTPH